MWRVTWRNLFARKVRLLLSGFAIVLGVAFVAGSFILTDTIRDAFTGIIKGSTPDVQVAPRGSGNFDSGPDSRTIGADVVKRLETLKDAAAVDGGNQVTGVYVLDKGDKVLSSGGAPGLAFDYGNGRAITGNRVVTITDGKPPVTIHQIALDSQTAKKGGYHVGDKVDLVTPGPKPRTTVTLTGIFRFGQTGNTAGATLTLYSQQAIQQLYFHGKDVYSGVSLAAKPGVSQQQLASEAQKLLPPGLQARTGDKVAAEGEKSLDQALKFINYFLLVFAAISLVVGIFLIVNTFSILVAQRSRELALLRAMGASKRQVNRSVLTEAFAVGLVGTTAGVGVGYLLAMVLRWVFGRIGLDLTGVPMPVAPRTVIAAYLAGMVTTLIAAYLPARRAGRVSPVAAMRDEVAMPETSLRRRTLIGALLVVVGAGGAILGFLGSGGLGLLGIGLGALAVLIGVALMSPLLGRPVVRLIGLSYRALFGSVGTLATQNTLRNPRRTAATSSALMIGLALVATMSILGQSAKASTDKAVNETLTADFVVSNAVGSPFSPTIAQQIRKQPGVQTVAEFRSANGEIDGSQVFLGAADPRQLPQVLAIPMEKGSVADLNDGTILVDKNTASGNGYAIGDTIRLKLQGGTQSLKVAGIFSASAAVPANYIITLNALAKGALQPQDSLLFITPKPGVSPAELHAQIDPITRDLPTISLQDQSGFADTQSKQIDQFLLLIYSLLAFSIIIAALGIVNTLALSVIERTREVGLLRAIGLSRRQLRRMVRLESIAIAVLGAVLGVVIGIAFGVALVKALSDQGLDVLAVPWAQLVIFVLVAIVIGVLAAWLPARRAAKLNVLDAITTQ
ncbi:MAG: putative transport system permease protein [Nocardioidaceae bacterium]|jgi:putative ABC transport system permease protein|nr:putative transport system permease protein [Nocardioidaceae bacterium]